MPLSRGDKIGPYEILAPIGAGGMGEVYRARDTKLKREVALKVLPEAFARDPERMARFQREAEVLASLNHPNIATIYGVEERALVMELVEGDSPTGPLPFDEAWRIASQIATALEYAHEKGVVHRDLKPANVKITSEGVVKLLDFGLAKAFTNRDQGGTPSGEDPENSPTLTLGATEVGVILGTAAYMSPEQARGKQVDRRADIWSFGVVFYELLTGERLFKGENTSDTLAQVLTKEPNLDKVPGRARKLLGRCLEKDPKKRLRDIGEAAYLLDDGLVAAPSGSQASSRLRRFIWLAATLGVLAVTGISWTAYRFLHQADKPLVRLSVDLGPEALAGDDTTVAISPTGTRLVFPARSNGKQMLATRLLDQFNISFLNGTENGSDPFFSPDGQWIGFFAGGKLKKISLQGGAPVQLCEFVGRMGGGSWGEDDNIYFATDALWRIPANGGNAEKLTATNEDYPRWPQVLPGGKAVIITTSPAGNGIAFAKVIAISLQTGKRKTLISVGHFGRYIPSNGRSGHLVYLNQGGLMGVPLDPMNLEVRGTPTPLAEDVVSNPANGAGDFDFSQTGSFVYRRGKPAIRSWPVMWMDSSQRMRPLLAKPGIYESPRLSPDGQRLAVSVRTDADSGSDIFIYDWQRDTMSRLTSTGHDVWPAWAPDGKHIVYRSRTSSGDPSLMWVRADGAGESQLLFESKKQILPNSFRKDGRLAYGDGSGGIFTMALDLKDAEHPKPGKPESFLPPAAGAGNPAFSPDGKWLAYQSRESGRGEVEVRPFPGPGGKWQVSANGGMVPIWSPNGRELFFETLDRRIMVVDYTARGDSFVVTRAHLWADRQLLPSRGWNIDLAPDGKRFAVFPLPDEPREENGNVHVTYLENFFDELRRKAPTAK